MSEEPLEVIPEQLMRFHNVRVDSLSQCETSFKGEQEQYASSINLHSYDSCETDIKQLIDTNDCTDLSEDTPDAESQCEKANKDVRETRHEKIQKDTNEQLLEKIKRLEKERDNIGAGVTVYKQPVEHDDSVDTLKDQVKHLRKTCAELEAEKKQLADKSSRRPTYDRNFEMKHLKKNIAELEDKLSEEKKRVSEVEEIQQKTQEELSNYTAKMHIIHEENANLTLELNGSRSMANRWACFYDTISAVSVAVHEELAEVEIKLSKLQHELDLARSMADMDARRKDALTKENIRLHRKLQILNTPSTAEPHRLHAKKCLVPQCDLCQQLYFHKEGPCRYHPIPPMRHARWVHMPELRTQAEDPIFADDWFYLCCEKLAKKRPDGCCNLGSHDTGLFSGLHG